MSNLLKILLLFCFPLVFTADVFSEEKTCASCHTRTGPPAKNVHAALDMGCETCHQPVENIKHPEQKGGFRLKSEMPGLCYNCHDEAKFKGKFIHPPVSGGICTLCHDPHRSNNIALLTKQINDLCVSCHTKLAIGVHMLAGIRGAHPTWKKPDPSRPGREMSCTSCHNPHSSGQSSLFLYPGLCGRCHKY